MRACPLCVARIDTAIRLPGDPRLVFGTPGRLRLVCPNDRPLWEQEVHFTAMLGQADWHSVVLAPDIHGDI